ncbi:MAG: hypothetical protein HY574_08490 [candidate division NC10 bacterium]|nr:hypothetical protein [candidate division NC10 bacterium]
MEHFETIKKSSSFLIIPLFWLAYFVDFDVSHVHDRVLESATFLSGNFVFGAKVVVTMLLVTIALLVLYELLVYVSAHFLSSIPFAAVAIILSCFGVAGLFKQIDAVPFQPVNIFWHLGSLAAGTWLFEFINRVSNPNA